MFRFCLCGDPKPLNSCCQASTDRSGHSGDLVIHSCPKALLESTLNSPQNPTFGQLSNLWEQLHMLICGNDLLNCNNDLLTCGNDLLTCGNDLITCGNDLLSSANNLLTCGNDLMS